MTRAVLLDALGTLVYLEPPWVHLAKALGTEPDERLIRAVRAEMAYYKDHSHEGRDARRPRPSTWATHPRRTPRAPAAPASGRCSSIVTAARTSTRWKPSGTISISERRRASPQRPALRRTAAAPGGDADRPPDRLDRA